MAMAEATLSTRDAGRKMGDADNPRDSLVARFGPDKPLRLDAGVELSPFQIAYKTYGTLNAAKSNAVLVCHALTGDQYAASVHPVTGKGGWWDNLATGWNKWFGDGFGGWMKTWWDGFIGMKAIRDLSFLKDIPLFGGIFGTIGTGMQTILASWGALNQAFAFAAGVVIAILQATEHHSLEGA